MVGCIEFLLYYGVLLLYGSIQHNRRVTRPLYGYTAMQRNAPYSNTAPYIIQHNTLPLSYRSERGHYRIAKSRTR